MKRCKLKFKLGLFAAFTILAVVITAPHYVPALFLSVSIHELGHIFMARLCKIPLRELRLGIFGASLFPDAANFSYFKEIMLCAGGPIFNFLCVAVGIMRGPLESSLFLCSSLALGTLNLLPVYELDGGRMLSAILHTFFPIRVCDHIIKLTSFSVIFSLWVLSVYLILRAGTSLTLFVFSASSFAKIFLSSNSRYLR